MKADRLTGGASTKTKINKQQINNMKTFKISKYLSLGLTLAGAAFTPGLHATETKVFIEGGSASSSVIAYELAQLFGTGTITTNGSVSGNVYRFSGTSTLPVFVNNNYNPLTIDVNLANGAIAGLKSLVSGNPGNGDTNYLGTKTAVTFVDSATSPEAVGIDATANNIDTDYLTYVVPLVFAKNTNSIDTAPITNLTARQAVTLETSLNKTTFFGGTSTNVVYFVGRNNNGAVRTEIDLAINNSKTIKSYFTNAPGGAPVLDTNPTDPGLASASKVVAAIQGITNSIGTIAVQNLTVSSGPALVPLSYEGVPYSETNVINGSYALWGYEHYYFIPQGSGNGSPIPGDAQQAVLDTLYSNVTNNVVLQAGVYNGNFIPAPKLKVKRTADGGPIIPLANY